MSIVTAWVSRTGMRLQTASWLGVGVLGVIMLFCWLGPLVHPGDPLQVNAIDSLQPPSGSHPLGTDTLGRDVLARLMGGGQLSLATGVLTAVIGVVLGTVLGLTAATRGGVVDTVLMRVVDMAMALPAIFIIMLLSVMLRPGPWLLSVLVALGLWAIPARLVRAEALSILSRPYCEAALSLGSSRLRLSVKHILPNSFGTIAVAFTFLVADAILLIAALSFLGFGIAPPAPSWGGMLTDAQTYIFVNAWWLIYPPGLLIILTIVAVNLVGDGLRDSIETRQEAL